MKKLFLLLLIVIPVSLSTAGQRKRPVSPVPSYPVKYIPGWVNSTDFTAGLGLGVTNDPSNPCDKSFTGLNTSFAYQINRSFMTGAGTGIMFNEDRFFVPLYLSGRYTRMVVDNSIAPFVHADAGFLLNFKDFNNETRTFVNPVIGARFVISPYIAATAAAGYFVHMGPFSPRNSFLNLKVGMMFMLKRIN